MGEEYGAASDLIGEDSGDGGGDGGEGGEGACGESVEEGWVQAREGKRESGEARVPNMRPRVRESPPSSSTKNGITGYVKAETCHPQNIPRR